MNKEQKAALVEELAGELKDAGAVLAIDYRGISVPQAAELRSALREADTRFRVVKNRLTLRAADAAGTEALKEHLEGPTALAFVGGDIALAAKTISRLGSQWKLLDYKGGLMEGDPLDPDAFATIARLPALEVLHGQFAGMVASPLTGLVRGLGSMVQGLAIQLEQIRERGLVEGQAPAEEQVPAKEGEGEASGDQTPAEQASAAEESQAQRAESEAEGVESEGEADLADPGRGPQRSAGNEKEDV
jgi:large subunit ribosomal protein L10